MLGGNKSRQGSPGDNLKKHDYVISEIQDLAENIRMHWDHGVLICK